jgi:hypothetical protein
VVSSQPGDSWPPQQISGDGACIARNPPADGAVVRAWFAVLPHNPAGFARFGRATSLEAVWRIAGAGGRNRFAAGPNPFSMEHPNRMPSLRTAYDDFVASVLSIPEARFLASMDGWAPRDVVAHLIGWNRFMIQACASIRLGEPPAYYADAPNDYRNINAALVEHYASRSRLQLLAELAESMAGLEAYLAGLPASELASDWGVTHYTGEPASVGRIVRSLAGDYEHHTRQINAWLTTK